MKKLLLGTVSLLALATAAGAADMPVKATALPAVSAPTWAGFYLGIQGGVADHRGSAKDLDNFMFGGGPGAPATYSANKTGGIFGVNAGYNFQSGNLVYGAEGDWSWLGVKAGSTTPFPGADAFVTSFDVRWLATVRARAGVVFDANLLYVTGGVAFADINNSAIVFNSPVNIRGSFTDDKTKVGWTIGGGIERMFGPHWTARAEARYVDFGHNTVNCTPGINNCLVFGGGSTYRGEFRNSLLIGLLALDYKF